MDKHGVHKALDYPLAACNVRQIGIAEFAYPKGDVLLRDLRLLQFLAVNGDFDQIGRASCRERV